MTDTDARARAPLGAHLEELRYRLIIALLGIGAALVICWFLRDPLMRIVVQPHARAMRSLGYPTSLRLLQYPEGFYAYLKVALLAALVLSSPLTAYQVWAFVRSGLRPNEQKMLARYGWTSLGLFLMGVEFGFIALIPFGLEFLIRIGGNVAEPAIRIGSYVSLVMTLTLVTGLVFQLPLVMRFLSRAGVVRPEFYSRYRRQAIVGVFLLAAVLTPPDPFTQMMLAAPMIVLYEVGVLFAKPDRSGAIRMTAVIVAMALAVIVIGSWRVYRRRHAAEIVELGVTLPAPSRAWTYQASNCTLRFRDGARVLFRKRSTFLVIGAGRARLLDGEALVDATGGRQAQLVTSSAEITVENGRANVVHGPYGTVVTAVDGTTRLLYDGAESRLAPGRQRRLDREDQRVHVGRITAWTRQRAQREGKP